MKNITIVDTSINTDNIGDEIIMEAVNDIIADLFHDFYIFRVPSHDLISDRARMFIRLSSWCFVGGTNLLSSEFKPWNLWRLDGLAVNAFGSSRTICLGVGWNDYMSPPSPEMTEIYKTALSSDHIHAVRDQYTGQHLQTIGISSAFTSCPTTWQLTPNHCASIPTSKADSAVITLSAWRSDIEMDKLWIDAVRKKYKKIFFFPQMFDDYSYFRKLGYDDIIVAASTLKSYDQFLEKNDVDFIGTRLHGGIRALQKGRRALILSIDNRAAELGKDTGLPVLPRSDTPAISHWIQADRPTELILPQDAIDRWKAQFLPSARAAAEPPMALPDTVPPPPFAKRLRSAAKIILGRS
jgi:polysaccharide pyruvyl transferase WcaK-like protein